MSITTIIGPMFSGKTTEFIRLIERKKIAGKKCLIIKHFCDTRFNKIGETNSHVTTHSNIIYKKCDIMYLQSLSDTDNTESINMIKKIYDVIGIEEGFFFEGLANFANELANNNIEVIVSTIDSSYKQELFPEIGKLISLSEIIIKLNAVCMMCKNSDAHFTIRTVDNDEEILVGGTDKYKSVCRKCLNNYKIIHNSNDELITKQEDYVLKESSSKKRIVSSENEISTNIIDKKIRK
ncbi:thymidine kinase [Cotonvirus japonicus]|uniref:Thymidine kinase n=1 Tax=Cotonvirus japonicus TaxID=2811091 RepID=A0ABM7NS76_9VIRU|nr:thymidine kinase [Cotonvirus japonicus]BCS83012.1 thymidine kinase [Cotonvirus japonicus]